MRDVDLSVGRGQFFTLLGPSGCGKTTLLRCIAGLHRPDGGSVVLDGRTVFSREQGIDVAPNQRRIGMVFQSHAVWPHLDVFANVAFPLESLPRSRRPPPSVRRSRVLEALEMVELADLVDRPSGRLSGGQQQRLALARALVGKPDLLLLDEPLSNLDARLRGSMRMEVKRLQREVGVTVLYVTHDQDEALSMSTEVAVMSAGELVQVGSPTEIYERPTTRFVAESVGRANLYPGRISVTRRGQRCIDTDLGRLLWEGGEGRSHDGSAAAMIRPEDVELRRIEGSPAPSANAFEGDIVDIGFRGAILDVVVRVKGCRVEARAFPGINAPLSTGDRVLVSLPPAAVRVVSDTPQDGQTRSGS